MVSEEPAQNRTAQVDSDHSPDSFASETERTVAQIFAKMLELELQWVSADDDIFMLGGDSFEALRIALELERVFNIALPAELLESGGRVRYVAAWIDAQLSSADMQVQSI